MPPSESPIACVLEALDSDQRQRHLVSILQRRSPVVHLLAPDQSVAEVGPPQ